MALSTGALLFGAAGLSALAQIGQARAQSKLLRRQARAEQQASAFEARQFGKQESGRLARARALRAGSGVAFTGTPLLVDEATVQEIALGEANIRRQGQISAQNRRAEADIARRTGRIRAFNTLLSAGSSFAANRPAPTPGGSGG